MSHLDEGTLHALLDGELDLHEVKEIQAHIGSCTACGTRLREVKEFHGESDRLVAVLEAPVMPSRRVAAPSDDVDTEPEAAAAPLDDRATPRPPVRRAAMRTSGPAAEPPPLLLPDSSEHGRGRWMRRMRWAALLFVTVGAGYLGSRTRQAVPVDLMGRAVPGSTDSVDGAVLSSVESSTSADSGPTAPSAPAGEAKAAARTPQRPPAPQPARQERAPEPAAARKDTPESNVVVATGFRSNQESPDEPADSEASDPGDEDAVVAAAEAQSPAQPPEDVRSQASEALRELDRERREERARAAMAALDSARARSRAPANPAPAPRTPEQRAQIYLRIGLDEAAKQLGRPVHVIEGMSAMFMGLAFGRNSPGADPTRAVVRVVYQDSQGRLILLDQQRLRPGQSTSSPGNEPHWVTGEIALHLSGEVGPDVLRNYRARVR